MSAEQDKDAAAGADNPAVDTVAADKPPEAVKPDVAAIAASTTPEAPSTAPAPAPAVAPAPAPQPASPISWEAVIPAKPPRGPKAMVLPSARALVARYGAQAAAVLAALGIGYEIARAVPQANADSASLHETTAGIRDSRQALAKLGDEMTALKTSVERIKQSVDRPRGESAKLNQTLERLDQGGKESADRIARLGEQLERVERTQRDPARIAALTDRLDRMEKQMVGAIAARPAAAAAPVALQAAAAPKPSAEVTGSIAPAKLDGWILREAEDGIALIQSRSGRLREVVAGQTLPGGIRVRSIERRGRAWVVVTSQGLITPN